MIFMCPLTLSLSAPFSRPSSSNLSHFTPLPSFTLQKGNNAFHLAVENGHIEIVAMLLDAQAELVHSRRHVSDTL